MKKAIFSLLIAISLVASPAIAQDAPEVVAIVDVGFDTRLAPEKIVGEACFSVFYRSCANAYSSEGAGSSSLSPTQLTFKNAMHGTNMWIISQSANPNAKYVLVRTSSFSSTNMLGMTDSDLRNALAWIVKNKEKYGISSVAISASRKVTGVCPVDPIVSASVNSLSLVGVPVIAAAGNDYNYTSVGYPSCIPEVISIGSVGKYGYELYSNGGSGLDYAASGTMSITYAGRTYNVIGTSVATQVFVANMATIKKNKGLASYGEVISLIDKTHVISKNKYVAAKAINLSGALA